MSGNKHIITYSATDIEKYRKGELSAREMHDLEQAALDDPFLADAIEGLTAHPDPAEDLSDLHERLNKKVAEQARRRKVVILQRRIAFAAAVLLLLGIGYTFIYHSPNREFSAPASSVTNIAPQAVPAAKSAPGADTSSAGRADVARDNPPVAAQKKAADSIQYAFTQPKTNKKLSAPVSHYIPAAPAQGEAAKAYETLPSRDSTRPGYTLADRSADDDETSWKKDTLSLYKLKSASGRLQLDSASPAATIAAPPLVLNGTVLDLQNRPLAGAFLALNGKNSYGFTTNDHGQFQIRLHPGDTTRQLIVSMIGYDHASLAVNALSTYDQRDNIIRLRPSSANLDEVVVVGYGLHRKAAELGAPSVSNDKLDTLWLIATPVIGRQAYIQYLDVAKKKLALDSTIVGPETLSFAIARDGTLSAFKIEQSLSPAHDAGIFRLVTDGPGWRLIRGKKARASVTVIFP